MNYIKLLGQSHIIDSTELMTIEYDGKNFLVTRESLIDGGEVTQKRTRTGACRDAEYFSQANKNEFYNNLQALDLAKFQKSN